ncbi:hypothetical protein JN535_04720 [Cellulosimicrobium cellulans]|nr:hypothetical protein [Cellulosimicrobium cellulans]
MSTLYTKKAPGTAPTVIEGQSESRANGSPNHVPVPSKEKNMTIIAQFDATAKYSDDDVKHPMVLDRPKAPDADNVNVDATDEGQAEHVNVPDVVAPHIAAWNRLSEAAEPWVSNRDPHPRSAGQFVPWCAECVSAKEEGEVAHPLSDRKQVHESHPVYVYTGHSGTIKHQGGVSGLPSLAITATRTTKRTLNPESRAQFIAIRRFTDGEHYRVAELSISEAQELVDALQAAIDLATGRDDFDEAGA